MVREQLQMDTEQIRCIFAPRIVIHGNDTLCHIFRYKSWKWRGVQYLTWNPEVVNQLGLDTQRVEDQIAEQLLTAGAESSCLEALPFRSTGLLGGIPDTAFRGGAPLCRWYPEDGIWTARIREPPPGFPRFPTIQELSEAQGIIQATDTDSPFADEDEIAR